MKIWPSSMYQLSILETQPPREGDLFRLGLRRDQMRRSCPPAGRSCCLGPCTSSHKRRSRRKWCTRCNTNSPGCPGGTARGKGPQHQKLTCCRAFLRRAHLIVECMVAAGRAHARSREARTQPASSGQTPRPRFHGHAGWNQCGEGASWSRFSCGGKVPSREWCCEGTLVESGASAEPKSRITFAVNGAAMVCWAQQAQGTIWTHWKNTSLRRTHLHSVLAANSPHCTGRQHASWKSLQGGEEGRWRSTP